MDDSALESTVGQAYIKMDSYDDVDGHQISRVTFGQTVKIQANIDSLDLGNGGINGVGSDLSATNVSFGYINTATNEIVPFEFTNPYFEWATDASNNIIGFRMGAEETAGLLQMDISSFSGNIGMTINGTASTLYTGASGSLSNSRATYIGDNSGTCTDGTTCVSLGNMQSFSVADSDGSSTSDFFLSFQRTAKSWLLGDGSTYQATGQGFFMNVPTNNVLTISGTGTGTAGYAVEFIDRGVGRWNNP